MENKEIVLLDFGASGGAFLSFLALKSESLLVLIEPSSDHFLELKELHPDLVLVNAAAGRVSGETTLYDPTVGGASLFRRNDDVVYEYVEQNKFSNIDKTQTINIRSVGDICQELQISNVNAVKIDTQGSELEILHGLSDAGLIGGVSAIQVEMPSIPTSYLNQPSLLEVVSFMQAHDFWLYNIRGNNAFQICGNDALIGEDLGVAARVMDIDALFCKNPFTILASFRREPLLAHVKILCAFKYYREAQRMCDQASERKLISREDKEAVFDWIKFHHRRNTNAMVRAFNAVPVPRRLKVAMQTMLGPIFGSYAIRKFPHGL